MMVNYIQFEISDDKGVPWHVDWENCFYSGPRVTVRAVLAGYHREFWGLPQEPITAEDAMEYVQRVAQEGVVDEA